MKDFVLNYSENQVTAWGGMALMKKMLNKVCVKEHLKSLDLPRPNSNRGYDPADIMEAFWVSIWCGASRFAHSDYLRYDKTLTSLFGWRQAPSQSTYSRYFHKFNQKRSDAVFKDLNSWFFKQWQMDNVTLDVDSSVLTRYGQQQQGANKGYNPQKPGRNSHHPLMAFMSEGGMVVNSWLRQGATGAARRFDDFLEETLQILGDKKVGLLRADSGFHSKMTFELLESKQIDYIIAARMQKPLRQEIGSSLKWVPVPGAKGIEVAELNYQAYKWKKPRRMVVIRQNVVINPTAVGKLFEDLPSYRYSALFTSLETLPAIEVWRIYRGRAVAENRIKELKYDFGMDAFNLSKFFATEAAFRSIMVAYNLMALFKHMVLQSKRHQELKTLRFKCFALGAWITKTSSKSIYNLALAQNKRAWMDGLFLNISKIPPEFKLSNA